MSRQLAIALIILVAALAGCSEDAPTGPTGAEMEAERARVKAEINKGQRAKPATAVATSAAPGQGDKDGSFSEEDDAYTAHSHKRRPN